MIPSTGDWPWDATLATFTEALNDGFAGEFSVAGDSSILGPATERAAAAGVPLRQVEASAGTSVTRLAHAAAKGSDRRLQVLLTAPAVPLPGWLPSMLALLGPERDAGVVGARIVSRFGFLEEAGGILADGKRERRGEGDSDPDRPEYRFVRKVDFCSPPLVATKRELFDRLGGVEEGGASPDDALVDFSLRAGQAGAPVYYQPEARVVALGNGDP
jgi:GT2 family glycosyltransferase